MGWLQWRKVAAHESAPYIRIPARLARRRLFRALPAEYPANTEVEAHERPSADDLYDEQQVSAHCGEEQLLGKGNMPAMQMFYLRIASGRITTMEAIEIKKSKSP